MGKTPKIAYYTALACAPRAAARAVDRRRETDMRRRAGNRK